MPCRSDYQELTPAENRVTQDVTTQIRKLADMLTYSNDVLRDYLLGARALTKCLAHINRGEYVAAELARLVKVNKNLYVKVDAGLIAHVEDLLIKYNLLNDRVVKGGPLNDDEYQVMHKAQVGHREADLSRLMKTFAESGDRVRLRKVLDADPEKPLEPQLGFDADEF